MKIITCFLLFFCVSCCCSDSDVGFNYYVPIFYHGDQHDDYHKNKEDNESKDPIERPCSLDDKGCVRNYFAHNAYCSPTHGPAPDPYRIKTLSLDLPHANITFIVGDATVKGFNDWKIKEFYINKKTDYLVLEVEFEIIKINSTKNTIRYNRKGKEPLELNGVASVDYKSLPITMTAPHIKNIDLSNAIIFTYVPDVAPEYYLDTKYTDNKDPDVMAANKELLGNIRLSLQEGFIKMGRLFMLVFVQSSICDFYMHTYNYE